MLDDVIFRHISVLLPMCGTDQKDETILSNDTKFVLDVSFTINFFVVRV